MSEFPWQVAGPAGSVRLRCRVQPRSSRNAFAGVLGDAVKIALTAPPVDGKANQALTDFLAGAFGVGRHAVRVVAGAAGRTKIIEIDGISPAAVAERIN